MTMYWIAVLLLLTATLEMAQPNPVALPPATTTQASTPPTTVPTTFPARTLTYDNPFIRQRADPFILRDGDGIYYFTATVPEYDRIILRRDLNLNRLRIADEKTIWTKHPTGPMGSHIWAPEIHRLNNKWYIYFAAGGAEKVWDIRMYVLENASANPLEGEWVEKGQIKTKWESFSLDATTFEHRGIQYLVWAQHDPSQKNNTDLYIAKMKSPWEIEGDPVRISRPEYEWEKKLYQVNEGPAILIRNGRVFITYSASGTDYNYCMGLLMANENSNLLDAASWKKSPEPVFKTSDTNGIYGPGHNCFTVAEDGKTDLFAYHARDYKQIHGDPLQDRNRDTRVQALEWNKDGTPHFGEPRKTDANATLVSPFGPEQGILPPVD